MEINHHITYDYDSRSNFEKSIYDVGDVTCAVEDLLPVNAAMVSKLSQFSPPSDTVAAFTGACKRCNTPVVHYPGMACAISGRTLGTA